MTERPFMLTAAEWAALADGTAARLLHLEARYGGQKAVLDAHPELRPVARAVQRIRAKAAAAFIGVDVDLSRGRPLPLDVLADAERAFRLIVAAHDD
jgi:hypothetical protein